MTAAARTSERNSNWTPYWLISALLKPTRSHPEPQLSGPGKADALDTAPAVPRSNDSRMAASRESLLSSRGGSPSWRSEEHTSELQSHSDLVCRLLLEK